MVQFVGVEQMVGLLSTVGVEPFLAGLAEAIEGEFLRWEQFDKVSRVASHSAAGVIELMPVSDDDFYAFKYVNGHPANTRDGLQTVTAFGALADVATGYPLLLSEMTLLTALRTAATSALAARHLARRDATVMAIIGLGAQSEFQALAFKALLGIRRLRVYDIDAAATAKFQANMAGHGLEVVVAGSTAEAVRGACIVTTVTADKRNATILTAAMVEPGQHLNAVGGDCPGKTELDPQILHRADVFVEFPEQTRIEGEIQQMPDDFPVTELWRVISGVPGRRDADQITVFDSVGFALEDLAALRFLRERFEARVSCARSTWSPISAIPATCSVCSAGPCGRPAVSPSRRPADGAGVRAGAPRRRHDPTAPIHAQSGDRRRQRVPGPGHEQGHRDDRPRRL